jgi:hypothetical protein
MSKTSEIRSDINFMSWKTISVRRRWSCCDKTNVFAVTMLFQQVVETTAP